MVTETEQSWTQTRLPIAVFTKESCGDPIQDKIFGPKPVGTGDESFTGILASAGASLIVDGVSAILKSAGEARTDLSPVETSFLLSIDKGPRCFEIQKLKKQGSGLALEVGLQQGGASGDEDKYFRLIPTRLRYNGPRKSFLQFMDGEQRALALNTEISLLDGTSSVTFTINLGEWKKTGGDVVLNAAALKTETPNTSLLEVAGPWFVLKGSAKSERPYNVKFTLVETKSENALAKMLGAEVESRKTDIKDQLTTAFTPPVAPTTAELQTSSDEAFDAISGFCSRHRPALEAAAKGTDMSILQITNFNTELRLLTAKLQGTPYAGITQGVEPLSLLPENDVLEINSQAGVWASNYIKTFNKLCGVAPPAG